MVWIDIYVVNYLVLIANFRIRSWSPGSFWAVRRARGCFLHENTLLTTVFLIFGSFKLIWCGFFWQYITHSLLKFQTVFLINILNSWTKKFTPQVLQGSRGGGPNSAGFGLCCLLLMVAYFLPCFYQGYEGRLWSLCYSVLSSKKDLHLLFPGTLLRSSPRTR